MQDEKYIDFARILDEGEKPESAEKSTAEVLELDVLPVLQRIEQALAGGFVSLSTDISKERRAVPATGRAKETGKLVSRVPHQKTEKPTFASTSQVKETADNQPSVSSPVAEAKVVSAKQSTVISDRLNKDQEEASETGNNQKAVVSSQEKPKSSTSKEAIDESRHKREAEAERKGLVSSIRGALGNWNGQLLSESADKAGDVQDAAGAAGTGVFWGGLMEVKESLGGLSDAAEDQDSLVGILKKKLEDKTGITTVKEKTSEFKEKTIEKLKGGKTENLPDGYKRDKSGKLRNEKGHFVKSQTGSAQALREPDYSDISSPLDTIADQLAKSEKENDKRHGELLNTVAESGEESLFDTALGGIVEGRAGNLFGGGSERTSRSRSSGKRGRFSGLKDKFSNLKRGKLGKVGAVLGSLGGGALGVGSILPSFFGGDSDSIGTDIATDMAQEAVSNRVEARMEKKAGTVIAEKGAAKAGSKLGAKGLAKGAMSVGGKALRALGPIAALATAGYDAYQGWNDEEMQSEAFGLKKGQEASTGQKTAAAAANVLDLGGFVSGGLSMMGMDIDTADIAKGLFDTGASVGDFFGFGEEEQKNAEGTISKPKVKNPESVSEVEAKKEAATKSRTAVADNKQKRLEEKLEKLVAALEKGNMKEARNIAQGETPAIPVEFDDTATILMAHDRM